MKETKEVCNCLLSPDSQRPDEDDSESTVDMTRFTEWTEGAWC